MRLKKYVSIVIVTSALFVVDGWPVYAQKKSSERASALVAGMAGDEWLRFRGPNGSGVAESKNLPAEFGPKKNLRWRTVIPFGRSSPIIVGDRIFLTASEGEKLITLCLHRKTGKVLWRRDVVRARHMPIYRLNDSASPTPVSDGKNVYVFFAELGLISYGPDGTERWRLPLGPFNSFYGMAASPVIAGNKLVMVCDQRTNSFILAVDVRNGKVLWKKERPNIEAYSTPVIYTPEGGSAQLIVLGSHTLDAYSLDTGERLWWVRQVGWQPKGVPVLGNDMVYISAPGSDEPSFPPFEVLLKGDSNNDGRLHREEVKSHAEAYDHFGWGDTNNDGYLERSEWEFIRTASAAGYGVVAIRLGGKGDLSSTNVAWRFKKTFPNVPAPLLYGGVLYLVKTGGIITTLDPKSGEVLKTERTPEALEDYFSSPVAADGKVFAVSESGKVTVLKAGAQWEILAVNDLGEECWATPAIAGDSIYIRTRDALYCFSQTSK